MNSEIHISKILRKHVSCKSKCKFDGRKIELKLLNELILIRQANQKSAIFVTIGIF